MRECRLNNLFLLYYIHKYLSDSMDLLEIAKKIVYNKICAVNYKLMGSSYLFSCYSSNMLG